MAARKPDRKPAVCPKSGSAHFHQAEFRRYRAEMYSSAPGGDLSAISTAPLLARICVCGYPIPDIPRVSIPAEERRSFDASARAALAYRNQSDSRQIRNDLAKNFATREELQELRERLERLDGILKVARQAHGVK
jgi:hypothetical protein